MKTIFSSKRHHYLARVSILLIAIALIVGIIGCGGGGGVTRYQLTISSTTGGNVTIPGEGSFVYNATTVVNLIAEAEEGCQFAEWSGDVHTIPNLKAATTYIIMFGHYSITANFEELFAGGNGTEEYPYQIANWHHLHNFRYYLDDHFIMMNDLDSTTPGYTELASPTANQGKGWQPIRPFDYQSTGTFDGQGYEISDLFIDRPGEAYVGLFGVVEEEGVIENVGVANVTVIGDYSVGGLVAWNSGNVTNCYSTGSVTGNNSVGGLVGTNDYSTVRNCYSTSNVSGHFYVGGLVGTNWYSTVSNSYSTGNVTGEHSVGGLVGFNDGTVSDSYSTDSVTGDNYVGGLVGFIQGGTISNSYSTGSVTGNSSVGGLVGKNYTGTVTNSFWDTQTSGQNTSAGGTGKTTVQMKNITTFSGATWNITAVGGIGERNTTYIWNIVNSVTYPFLSWQPI